jgi:hypothetical protein
VVTAEPDRPGVNPSSHPGRLSAYDLTCWFGYDLTCWSSASGSWHGFTSGDQCEAVFEAVAGAVDG